tara:strand:+ start:9110 stop:9259 length:150 start_codon:yes stop_codon:yes gene_type:complete
MKEDNFATESINFMFTLQSDKWNVFVIFLIYLSQLLRLTFALDLYENWI